MAYIGRQSVIGNFVKLDSITAVNGQAAYTMQNGGANFTDYSSVNQFMVSLNSVIQSPGSSFTVSGSTLTFASNLATGDVIDFVIVFGNSLSSGVPTDATVTAAKLTANAITGQTAETSIATDDTILIHDTSASALRKMTRANFVSGIGGTNTPAFQATKRDTSHQTFSTTPTKITFSNEDFDTDSMFASNRFTPTTAGKYFLYFQVLGQPNNENLEDAYLKLYKNGSAIGNYASDSQFATVDQFANGQNNSLSGSFTDTANGTGDYYEIYAYYSESFTVTDAVFGGYKLIGV